MDPKKRPRNLKKAAIITAVSVGAVLPAAQAQAGQNQSPAGSRMQQLLDSDAAKGAVVLGVGAAAVAAAARRNSKRAKDEAARQEGEGREAHYWRETLDDAADKAQGRGRGGEE